MDDDLTPAQEKAQKAGKVGGRARAEALAPAERSEIARKAVQARWHDSDTKLVLSWLVGLRGGGCAYEFVQDVTSRISGRTQITTAGLAVYDTAIGDTFGSHVGYAVLQKLYATVSESA